MDIPKHELFSILQEFNPWWSGRPLPGLPSWKRSASDQIWTWISDTATKRSLLLTGARQVGKTTLYLQTIQRLLKEGIPPSNIVYITFDHGMLKLAGLEATIRAWEELYPADPTHPQFLFLDEINVVGGWQTWLKHQHDFQSHRRIAVTGSAIPLREANVESGVGRWETIPLPTLSFREFLRLRNKPVPNIAKITSLQELLKWTEGDFIRVAAGAKSLSIHFHEYLIRGGFPEPANVEDLAKCQRLLREDIVDKVLKRNLTAQFGVRRVLEVEKLFLYLCYHDGGILDISAVSRELEGVSRTLAGNFLDIIEATHLIYRLKPFGYGKQILKGKDKIYLADAALPGAMMLLGQKMLTQPERLGAAVETAFFKHVFTRYYGQAPIFSYWRDRRGDYEVDLIAEPAGRIVPFEVKYHDAKVSGSKLKGLRLFMEEKKVELGYAITQRWEDFGAIGVTSAVRGKEDKELPGKILAIPAPLACFWLSSEVK